MPETCDETESDCIFRSIDGHADGCPGIAKAGQNTMDRLPH